MGIGVALAAVAVGAGFYLDVPFVHQSEGHCGGAALAMVLRYWGQDVAPGELVAGGATSRRLDLSGAEMKELARDRGFVALSFSGARDLMLDLLRQGRPVIAALPGGGDRETLHFVVVTGWDASREAWLVHDPDDRPYRRERGEALEREWRKSGSWALLVVPDSRALLEEEILPTAASVLQRSLEDRDDDPEEHHLLGLVLAKQGNWDAAEESFRRALRFRPSDVDTLCELAGVGYRQGRSGEAIELLRQAIAQEPSHPYANEFLATLLYLEGQPLQALSYWNRVGEPRIETIRYRLPQAVRAETVHALFRLNEGERLELSRILEVEWKRERLALAPGYSWRLTPAESGEWGLDVAFATRPAPLWLDLLLSNSALALADRSLELTLAEEGGWGSSGSAFFRFDEDRKRLAVRAKWPFVSSSADGLWVEADWREELWSRSSFPELDYTTRKVTLAYEKLLSSRRSVVVSGSYQSQRFRSGEEGEEPWATPRFFRLGLEWSGVASLRPDDRVRLRWASRADGFYGAGNHDRSVRTSSRLELERDSPSFDLRLAVSGGLGSRELPFDRYFLLGVGPDSPLPLRAHPTLDQGRKGASPMGRGFLLVNFELHRKLLRRSAISLGVTAFSDTAKVASSPFPNGNGGGEWLWDAGAGLSVSVLGRTVVEALGGLDLKHRSPSLWVGLSRGF